MQKTPPETASASSRRWYRQGSAWGHCLAKVLNMVRDGASRDEVARMIEWALQEPHEPTRRVPVDPDTPRVLRGIRF